MADENKQFTAIEKDYSQKGVRKALGIPSELNNRPVLHLSSHRGVLDSKYKSHRDLFIEALNGKDSPDTDRESAYLDLTTATQEEIINHLREYSLRIDPNLSQKHLQSGVGLKDPLPGFMANIQYFPPLDEQGNSHESSYTFSIDHGNYQLMLKRLKEFLDNKGVLKK